MLVPTDHSNILFISKVFKLYQKFHNQIECSEYSLNEAILGAPQVPKSQVDSSSSTHDGSSTPHNLPQAPYCFNDEVIEKPDVCSTLAP